MRYIISKYDSNLSKRECEKEIVLKYLYEFYGIDGCTIGYSDNGKPLLSCSLHVSISNCNDNFIVVFSNSNIGVDMELIREVDASVYKYLNIDLNKSNVEALMEYCAREAVIKLEDLKLYDIKNLDISKYNISYIDNDKYIICTAEKK